MLFKSSRHVWACALVEKIFFIEHNKKIAFRRQPGQAVSAESSDQAFLPVTPTFMQENDRAGLDGFTDPVGHGFGIVKQSVKSARRPADDLHFPVAQ